MKIKFNLNFGGEQIRTLNDLRENFSIEDVLDVYNNGLLVKWLDVRNYKNELEKVKAIQTSDAHSILTELIKIFGVSSNASEIEESLSVLDYLEGRKKLWDDIKAGNFDEIARNITSPQNGKAHEEETHHASKKSYDDLVQEIIDNHQDLSHIYDCLDAITADYSDVLPERYSELFNRLYESRPHTIIPLFAHHGTRPYYTIDNSKLKDGILNVYYVDKNEKINIFDTQYGAGSFQNYGNPTWWPAKLLEKVNFLSMLKKFMDFAFDESDETITGRCPYIKIANFKAASRNWSTIEPPSKKIMLLHRYIHDDYYYDFICAGNLYSSLASEINPENNGRFIPACI